MLKRHSDICKKAGEYSPQIHRLRRHYNGLNLGPANPGTITVAQETLDIRCASFSLA